MMVTGKRASYQPSHINVCSHWLQMVPILNEQLLLRSLNTGIFNENGNKHQTVGTPFNKTKSEYYNRFLGVKMRMRARFCGRYEIIQRAGSDVCARLALHFFPP